MGGKEFLKNLTIQNEERFKIISGYITPCVGFIATISNILVVFVYIKQLRNTGNQIRKVSSILYTAIATSNILSSFPVAVVNGYIFSYESFSNYMPYELCSVWMYMLNWVYTPHMSSIWYVTLLSLQRYMVIKHPFTSLDKWSCKKTLLYVLIIGILSIAIQFPSSVDFSIVPYRLYRNETFNNTFAITCAIVYKDWTGEKPEISDSVINIVKLILCIMMPCMMIATCNLLLLLYLNKAKQFCAQTSDHPKDSFKTCKQDLKQKKLNHQQSPVTSQQDIKDQKNLLVLVFSSTIFVVHIPYLVIMSLYIHSIATKSHHFIKLFNVGIIRNVIDLTIHMTHPLLFILSCLLSQQFRHLLNQFWKCTKQTSFQQRTVIHEV